MDEAMAHLWDCCHEALIKLGFICFHLHSLPEWQALNWLVMDFVEIVSNLGLADEAPVRGAVIDILGIDMPFITVIQLLKHSVPVTYMWGDEERAAAVVKPTWLQWEPEHNGMRSAGAIQTKLNAKLLQTKKQAKQAKAHCYRKRAKKQNPTPQQPAQPKLSKAEKHRCNDERELQAACDSDDAALAADNNVGNPTRPLTESRHYTISTITPLNQVYDIPSLQIELNLPVSYDFGPDIPLPHSWPPHGTQSHLKRNLTFSNSLPHHSELRNIQTSEGTPNPPNESIVFRAMSEFPIRSNSEIPPKTRCPLFRLHVHQYREFRCYQLRTIVDPTIRFRCTRCPHF
ncbi:hypothetical protein JAAARDRAFT_197079 [Jaapia argillacea MUCL 33604]|uniref:Uncharacterized protein n=1 Tax=Jaapia argillacea MUCL 33604 TaxID=933084 RepID=A0A067PJH8_9AGAM|nr:hypothetical protein JAAARDRAFT_197079 [Jaapia argillacea MUCL 33604]